MKRKLLGEKLVDVLLCYAGTLLGWLVGALLVSVLYGTISGGNSEDGVFGWIPVGLVAGSLVGPWASFRVFRRRRGSVVGAAAAVLTAAVLVGASRWQILGGLLWLVPAAAVAVGRLSSVDRSMGSRLASDRSRSTT